MHHPSQLRNEVLLRRLQRSGSPIYWGSALQLLILCVLVSIPQTWGNPLKSELQENVSTSRRNAIVDAVEHASPGVVNISTIQIQEINVPPSFEDFWAPFFNFPFKVPQRRELHGLGSGVIIDQKGYVITNQHVIEGAEVTKVLLSDGREVEAKIIGEDFPTDLAVLEINTPDLTEIEFGNADELLISEWAIAIGHAFAAVVGDPRTTVTVGVVSATDRALKMDNRLYRHLIQTDASINPGNSGGALVNLYGQLIGINTAIYSTSGGSQGIGYAIPVNIAANVVDRLVTYGAVVPPYIGIEPQNLTPQLAETLNLDRRIGVLVAAVEKGSPAEEAGIDRRDLIEAIDQEPVSNSEIFWAITRLLRKNQTPTFHIFRDGKRKNLHVKIRELQWKYVVPGWGITIEQLHRKQAQKYAQRGVLVTKVDRRSTLARQGLRRGDLIYRINDFRINSLEDFKRITNRLRRPQQINLYFERDGQRFLLPNLIIR